MLSSFRDDGEDTREEKDLVRGYNFAEYHADVYDRTEEEVDFLLFELFSIHIYRSLKLDCECLGGGRIEHKEADKYIKVTFPFL